MAIDPSDGEQVATALLVELRRYFWERAKG
jgi:hypothetical protein